MPGDRRYESHREDPVITRRKGLWISKQLPVNHIWQLFWRKVQTGKTQDQNLLAMLLFPLVTAPLKSVQLYLGKDESAF